MKHKRKILIGFISICVAITGYLFVSHEILCTGKSNKSFVLNVPYNRVLIKLNNEETMRKLISLSNGRLITQEWTSDTFYLDQIKLRRKGGIKWRKYMSGIAIVESGDEYTKGQILNFKQTASVSESRLLSEMNLEKKTENLHSYNTTVEIIALNKKQCRINVSIEFSYFRHGPQVLKEYIDEQVQKSAEESIINMEKSLKEILGGF